MKKKSMIPFLFILVWVVVLSAAVNNEKALDLMKKGNDAFQLNNNPSQAFAFFKQAADLASGPIKADALLKAAYMSHLLGHKIPVYQNFIKEALSIAPEIKLKPADYRDSFRQIFSDIQGREKMAKKQTVIKPTPKSPVVQPQMSMKKGAEAVPQKQLKAKTAKQFNYSIKLSYAMGMPGSAQNQSWSEPLYGENAEYGISNKMEKSSSFNLGLGYHLNRTMGIGLGAIFLSSNLTATVNASVPNPWVFNSPRSATGTYASTLKANIFYLNFIYNIIFNKFSLNLFAGPAFFSSGAEMISRIEIQELFPNDTVTISFVTEKVTKSSFGFNGGLDLNYFFSSHLGVFIEGRYLSGSGTFTPGSQKVPGSKLSLGGLIAGAGLVYQF